MNQSAPDAPTACHVPFLVLEQSDGQLQIELHVARANQIHSCIQGDGVKALLICQGPDAYVSPDWLGLPDQVPTWTYTVVHVTGSVMHSRLL
ncbi:MAG: FMN-binding negative transcriptional regulator [Hyphomicrobiaceae bacterium]